MGLRENLFGKVSITMNKHKKREHDYYMWRKGLNPNYTQTRKPRGNPNFIVLPGYGQTPEAKRQRTIWYRLRRRSKALDLPFDLNPADIIIPPVCPALGIPLISSVGTGQRNDNTPSVDRIVPSKGYVKGNILVISLRANRIKNNATLEELVKIAEYYHNLELARFPKSTDNNVQ